MNYSDTRLPDFTPFLHRVPPCSFIVIGLLACETLAGIFCNKNCRVETSRFKVFFFFLIRIGESKLIGDLNTRFIRTRFAIIR